MSPCKECPFKKNCLSGWLGPHRIEAIMQIVDADISFQCHQSLETADPFMCKGYIHFRNNISKMSKYSDYLRETELQYKGSEAADLCFSSKKEFIDHHSLYKKN